MSKSFLLLSVAVFFALAPMPSFGGAPQETVPAPNAVNPDKPTADTLAKAKKLYEMDCAMCHGDNGNGQTEVAKSMDLVMADWSDPKTLASKQDGELFGIIRNGKDKMPPEASGRAKDEEVWGLVLYIRSLAKAHAPGSTPPQP